MNKTYLEQNISYSQYQSDIATGALFNTMIMYMKLVNKKEKNQAARVSVFEEAKRHRLDIRNHGLFLMGISIQRL